MCVCVCDRETDRQTELLVHLPVFFNNYFPASQATKRRNIKLKLFCPGICLYVVSAKLTNIFDLNPVLANHKSVVNFRCRKCCSGSWLPSVFINTSCSSLGGKNSLHTYSTFDLHCPYANVCFQKCTNLDECS